MKTKMLLQTTGLTIMIMLLTTLYSNAQIPIQGLAVDYEGIACWNADGSGPEPAATGHIHPFGYDSSLYYCASRDYVDTNPDAALCHFLDDITGFPLFVQALTDNGFTAGQVKIKTGLFDMKDDIEEEDWFTFNDMHYFNYYDGYYHIELNGEPMISGYINYFNIHIESTGSFWQFETNFTLPFDASANSSMEVQEVASAFITDMDGEELRFVVDNCPSTGITFNDNGREGYYFEVVSGYLEKGLPELPYVGLAADHEGIAVWDADGSGPEAEASGHTFNYGGYTYHTSYYIASRDYDGIDTDPNAALCHFTENAIGFPNLEIQLAYRGFTMDQLKVKSTIATLGNNIEGEDWGLNGSIYWYNFYGNTGIFEIAGEPILEYVVDTNFSFQDLNTNDNWESNMTYCKVVDISANASSDAQYVAASFLKDLGGHSLGSYMEGYYVGGMITTNGRDGVFHEIESGRLSAKLPAGTHIWENEISGTWDIHGSPYIVMGSLNVPDGEILVIDSGVVVKFNTTEIFMIDGCILAEGTEQNPILFTAYDNSVRWGGLGWDETPVTNDTSKFKHCIFEYAYGYGTEYGFNCGGAIAINMVDKIKITNCLFRHNLADKFTGNNPAGGAIVLGKSSIHISHCIFHDNAGSWGGALAICDNSNPVIDNCLFYNNEATYIGGGGGAVLVWTDCDPHFMNCTFADNHAADAGGAVELEFGGTSTFTNCIFWGNKADVTANQISVWDPNISFLNVYYCDVEDGLNGITSGFQGDYLYNIEEDPEFMGPEEDFPYALSGGSPCINYGTLDPLYIPAGWVCPEFCLCGNSRVYGYKIDLGCYESLITGYNEFENHGAFSVNIFPNPINSQPTIEIYLKNSGLVNISILDIHGRVVTELQKGEMQSGKNQLTWNAENISAGIYFCRLQTGNDLMTRKVIKLN